MRTTIKDIAAMAGVSVSTVSRALNDRGGMEEKTRKRILDIANRLGYRPSAFARGLVLQRTKTLMVLVPDLANYFFAEVTQELCSVCHEKGYKVLLHSTVNQPELEREYLASIREGAVDGAIIAPQLAAELVPDYLDLVRSEFPLVFVDRASDRFKTNSVLVDNRRGGEMAVEYLYAKGHRRIAFIGGNIGSVHPARDRHLGYISALQKRDIPVREEYVLVDRPSPDRGGVEAINYLLDLPEPPTAVFVDSDTTALSCIGTVHRRGQRVPEDLAIVGFDNLNISAFFDVPLTTVAQPKREIAEKAVGLVMETIKSRREEESFGLKTEIVAPQLIERASA